MPGAAHAAVQSAGVTPSDLTVKEVKVYVLKAQPGRAISGSTQQLASVVTHSGIEGNYTLATRYFHPNWSNLGWLEYAKPLLVGKSVLDLPVTIGEFIFSSYDYAAYIRRGACDIVRFIVDNIGGISGGMKVARLAECFGMECQPHN